MLTIRRLGMVVLALVTAAAWTAHAADTYTVDPGHSSVSFMVSHHGISNMHGRFNEFSGKFEIDRADPAKSSFTLSIKVASVDTNNPKRDEHLRAPDYFNVKQFPMMTFQSKNVKAVDSGYLVTGDLTMLGVTKTVTFNMTGGKEIEFKGVRWIGFVGTAVVKRSEFGMKTGLDHIGDDVQMSFGLEAKK